MFGPRLLHASNIVFTNVAPCCDIPATGLPTWSDEIVLVEAKSVSNGEYRIDLRAPICLPSIWNAS